MTGPDAPAAETRSAVVWQALGNFRDLGGTPAGDGMIIRSGVLFRSASVAYATEADVAALLDEFRLATVIDLRSPSEIEAHGGRGALGRTAVGYHHLPIVDVSDPDDRPRHYAAMLRERGDRVAAAIRLVATGRSTPVLIHCEAGCDRTGVVVAVLLGLVGVADADICADYARTADAMVVMAERIIRQREAMGVAQPGDRDKVLRWLPDASIMTRALTLVRAEWGDLPGWAAAHGLTGTELDRLRRVLLAPVPPGVHP